MDRLGFFAVGEAEAAGVDEFSVFGDGQRRAGDFVFRDESLHQLVEGGEVGVGLAGGARDGWGQIRVAKIRMDSSAIGYLDRTVPMNPSVS